MLIQFVMKSFLPVYTTGPSNAVHSLCEGMPLLCVEDDDAVLHVPILDVV